ncbi:MULTISPECIES: PASTA domain-containing protein [unclassified Geodermatophilus]
MTQLASAVRPLRRLAAVPVLLSVGVLASGCGSDETAAASDASTSSATSASASAPAPESTPAPAPVPSTTAAPTTPAPTTPAAPVVDFAMPSVVGMTLQDAQDLIQANGVLLSLSHDLLGTRNQVLDANWRVCTQNVPAGQRVTGAAEGTIDLGVVKLEESCP